MRNINGSATFLKLRYRISVTTLVVAGYGLLLSCTSPTVVGEFADSAQKGLSAGSPIFTDLYDSCTRRETLRPDAPIYPLFVPSTSKRGAPTGNAAPAACAQFQNEGRELTKMSDVLAAYFKGMQQLAQFNTVNLSSSAETMSENAATAAGISYTQIISAGKLASIVTQLATESYQRRRLSQLLKSADSDVAEITAAFASANKTYEDLLNQEQQTLSARYQSEGDEAQRAMLFLLNHAYTHDLDALQQRRSAAIAYDDVLNNIRDGHHKLTQATKLTGKEINAVLAPYTSKINGALPTLNKSKSE